VVIPKLAGHLDAMMLSAQHHENLIYCAIIRITSYNVMGPVRLTAFIHFKLMSEDVKLREF